MTVNHCRIIVIIPNGLSAYLVNPLVDVMHNCVFITIVFYLSFQHYIVLFLYTYSGLPVCNKIKLKTELN